MNVRFIQMLCQSLGRIVVSLSVVLMITANCATADEYTTTCNYNDELCGWVDEQTEPEKLKAKTILEHGVATLATAVGAYTGVALHKIIEPFAMVGAATDESITMVRILDQWWDSAVDYAESVQRVETEDAIQAIAEMEPIDVESYGPSVLSLSDQAVDSIDFPGTGIVVTPIDNLIGSAPMIFTINEPYISYDMSAADLRLRSVFPISTQPFCVRSRAAQWNPTPMWTEFDQVFVPVARKPIPEPVDRWMIDSCIEALASAVDEFSQPQSSVRRLTNPSKIGAQWAKMVASGNKVVMETTELIATYWPEPIAEPSASGEALLTRAEAVTGIPIESVAADQIAEAMTGAIIR